MTVERDESGQTKPTGLLGGVVFTGIDGGNSMDILLVSTYVVSERLSVMHEPAGVVEILVQNPQNTPYSEVQNTPLPK